MKEDNLRVVIAIGFLMQIVGFMAFAFLMLLAISQTSGMMDTLVIEFSQSFKDLDERLHQIHNRVLILEEQRDIERRLTAVEKALRTYCIGSKIEMCGELKSTN